MPMHRQRISDDLAFLNRRNTSKAQEQYAGVEFALSEYQVSKIFVSGNEQGLAFVGVTQNLFITDAALHLGDVIHLMAVSTKPGHN